MKLLTLSRGRLPCIAMAGVLGILPFFKSVEDPSAALSRFVKVFTARDTAGLTKIIHPEIISDADVNTKDVQNFLKRFQRSSLSLKSSTIDKKLKSEDGKTQRFQATLSFRGPVLSPKYPDPSTLNMTLLWVLEDGKWWLERPLSIKYAVKSLDAYPTEAQNEAATRFETAVAILDKLGIPGKGDLAWVEYPLDGDATAEYRELGRLYVQERGPKGVDPKSSGVQVLLKGASRSHSGLLQLYHGDFPSGPKDKRRPVPWGAFRDYATAAIKLGRIFENQSKPRQAERIYRRIISLGRQFLDEPGGYQFVTMGITVQKQGAEALARLLTSSRSAEKQQLSAFANLASRKLDLLQTALNSLDDMADYKSLKAAVLAAHRTGDPIFGPWGINTLAILALKGAPACPEAMTAAKSMVLVKDSAMKKKALETLDELASEQSGTVTSFIRYQKDWVRSHQVYGSVHAFR
ncbi:MAG: hypothetical protein WBG50_17590 [Desulfomonilaceae bacterium]